MDFDKYELSDELRATLKSDYESDISGLKSKNAELIEREKLAKENSEKLTLDMATAEENAKVALAEKDNNVEQYKLAVAERDEKIKSIQFEFQETENKRVLESAVNDFSTTLADDPAGRMYMQSQFSSMVEVKDGQVVSKDVTRSLEEVKQSLVSDKANASYIKANVGSGAGSAGSKSSGSAANKNKTYSELTLSERAQLNNS